MTVELYKKHRPTKLSQIVGQDDAVRVLKDMGKRKAIPHCLLFTGPSGVGKTTMIRILRRGLGCGDADYSELNAAKERGIEAVRSIEGRMHFSPISGRCRVWAVDEAHQLTPAAQGAFLKMLEDTPGHVYFMLATTDPRKLLPTIRTRSTTLKLGPLGAVDLAALAGSVAEKEGKVLSEGAIDRIVDAADGSARKALVLLHSIMGLEDEREQLDAIAKGDSKAKAIEIARLLLKGAAWSEIADVLKAVDDDPEQLRRMVLGYMTMVMLGGNSMDRCSAIIEAFRDNWYDCGRAGLVAACRQVIGR